MSFTQFDYLNCTHRLRRQGLRYTVKQGYKQRYHCDICGKSWIANPRLSSNKIEMGKVLLAALRTGKSQHLVCKETGIARDTIRKYWRLFKSYETRSQVAAA